MKKSLLAVAALTAFAGAAQAQSSVTVYGIIDMGFGAASQTSAGPGANTGVATSGGYTSQGNIVSKYQTSGIGGSGESTSRLGFKGTEDLGGGTSAFFTAEAALATDSAGAGLFTNSSATSNRQMFAGIAQKGIGAASAGIQYTPIHEAVGVTDAGGTNNVNGNVIYDRNGAIGTSNTTQGTGVVTQNGSGMATNTSYTVRSTNALVLKSENIAGFSGKAMIVAGGKDASSNSAQATTNNTGYGFGADYTWNKLYVTAAWQTFLNETASSTVFTAGFNGGAITAGVNDRDTQGYAAATYDFGIVKAYLQYVTRKQIYVNNGNIFVQRSAQQFGVKSNLTPAITTWASVGTGNINNTGSNGPKANFNGWQIGSDYNLSKRTNLYAIYGQTATSNAASGLYSANGAATASQALYSAQTSYNASSYAIGIRHTF